MDAVACLIKGFIIGLSIAAPVGPIGLLCIRRALADGPLAGFVSGLGAASADAVYGAIAGFGVTLVTAALVDTQTPLRLVGGVVLLGLGWRTARARPAERAAETASLRGLAGAYGSTLALTLTNPATILSFAAVFGGLGVTGRGDFAAMLVAGVFLGSAAWWLALATGVGLVRDRITPPLMAWINRLSGVVLAAFGLAALGSLALG